MSEQAEAHTLTRQTGPKQWEVQIGMSHTPERHTLRFVERRSDDTVELVCDAFKVENEGSVIRASLIRGAAEVFERFEDHARASVIALRGTGDGERIVKRPVQRQRQLTNEFLADIARRHAEHEAGGRPPTASIAAEEGVTVGAVKNWLRKARERGVEVAR
jgi:hypothetical protein